ncbi:sensor histidine kinase [Flavobacterium silvaticum]|uniref:histidine kinase n=1 Tax=Flavobacterium silvaticum TaxID=1852020 RepID=A0A972FPV8_9FLAO|nr:ATP-binding protein [Flavobacterium silvaticum]NMH29185.1 hypothetical protein [Flavobacterium silvaticum]
MRLWVGILFLVPLLVSGQADKASGTTQNCIEDDCRIKQAFLKAEYYLQQDDDLTKSQQWLERVRELHQSKTPDTLSYYIDSLQSELFYYMGLHQFGIHEGQKALIIAKTLNDSILMDDANMFIGINYFELKNYSQSGKYLFDAKKIYPKAKQPPRIRYIIRDEHIFNNIAQLKIVEHEPDSASWYIKKALRIAQANKSPRGIPNTLQTQGLIYLEKKQTDSARMYFDRSTEAALRSNFFDIQVVNLGSLMQCSDNEAQIQRLFDKAQAILKRENVNDTYRQIFYTTALDVFKKQKMDKQIMLVQDVIIGLEAKTRLHGNEQIQTISNQYIRSENRVLLLRIEELNRQRKTALLQLFAALLGVLVLLLAVISIRRTSKHQKMLLRQKNEISKDLHDDIGSGLSSILINADLLGKLSEKSERQQVLSAKIAATGKEVSQRLHTFIWSLNNENNSLRNFCEYVRHYAHTYFDGTSVTFHYAQDIGSAHTDFLNGQVRKQLFFCIKEILNNALKHSGATNVSIDIRADKKQLTVIVSDNGIGLKDENAFGNGLINIRKRMELLEGTIAMESGDGLETRLTIPF